MNLIPGVDINPAAKPLADEEFQLVQTFLNKSDLAKTWFSHGTEMMKEGKDVAMRGRKEWENLPLLEEGCDALVTRIKAENRTDQMMKLKELSVDNMGILRGAENGLIMDAVAWNQIAKFAPDAVDSRLRTNLNSWLRTSNKEVKLRVRNPDEKTGMKQCFAAVGKGYQAFDWDQLALSVKATQFPSDARSDIQYDGSRATLEVVLHNPYEVNELGVGRLFRVAIVISSADNGTEGYRIKFKAVRIACINCTLVADESMMFRTTHRGNKVQEVVEAAIRQSSSALDNFAARWSTAYEKQYHDRYDGTALGAEEVFKRLIATRRIVIPHLDRDQILENLMTAWNLEPGDTVAHVNAAITRMAHTQTNSWRSPWYQEDLEEAAGELLYQKNYVLEPIDEEKREEWEW
jgi:hypothetical protein